MYLGKEPQFTQFPSKFFNGDGTAMTVSLDYSPPNEAALLVFISGVRQDTDAYNISGTSLTFTGTVPSGTNNVQVVHMGLAMDVGVPGDDTVTSAKIANDAVGSSEIANNAVGNSEMADDAVGVAELSATGTASATTFLRGDNSWQTAGVSTLAALTDATVSSSDPTISTNPSSGVGHLWLNSTSGEGFLATDVTAGANVWTNLGSGSGGVAPNYNIDFLIIAGGGGGGRGSNGRGCGGGAGGYRSSYNS